MTNSLERSAVVTGATGLVGSACVAALAAEASFGRVTALVRTAVPGQVADATVRTVQVDFDRIEEQHAAFSVSHVFSALGTTIRAAGSEARFRQVDHGYPLRVARMARAAGVRHFLLVSSIGADAGARAFYLRVKGELEAAILALGFPAVTVVRPSVLRGDRAEFRLGEAVASTLGFAFPRKYRPVQAAAVARALVDAAVEDRPGVRIIENVEMHGGTQRPTTAGGAP